MYFRKLLAFWLLALMMSSTRLLANPQADVPQPIHDFGVMRQGEKIEVTFIIRNTGTQPLTIGNISTTCGCTVASVASRTIAPGKSTELKSVFDAGVFRGPQIKNIVVQTNDPAKRTLTLQIKGVVKPQVETFPTSINFGTLKQGKTFSRTIVMRPADPKTFKILGVDTRSAHITAGNPRQSKANPGAWEVPITVHGSKATPGRHNTLIQIKTNAKVNSTVIVRVLGVIE